MSYFAYTSVPSGNRNLPGWQFVPGLLIIFLYFICGLPQANSLKRLRTGPIYVPCKEREGEAVQVTSRRRSQRRQEYFNMINTQHLTHCRKAVNILLNIRHSTEAEIGMALKVLFASHWLVGICTTCTPADVLSCSLRGSSCSGGWNLVPDFQRGSCGWKINVTFHLPLLTLLPEACMVCVMPAGFLLQFHCHWLSLELQRNSGSRNICPGGQGWI